MKELIGLPTSWVTILMIAVLVDGVVQRLAHLRSFESGLSLPSFSLGRTFKVHDRTTRVDGKSSMLRFGSAFSSATRA